MKKLTVDDLEVAVGGPGKDDPVWLIQTQYENVRRTKPTS